MYFYFNFQLFLSRAINFSKEKSWVMSLTLIRTWLLDKSFILQFKSQGILRKSDLYCSKEKAREVRNENNCLPFQFSVMNNINEDAGGQLVAQLPRSVPLRHAVLQSSVLLSPCATLQAVLVFRCRIRTFLFQLRLEIIFIQTH